MELPDEKRQAISQAIYGGRKIEAIKLVRDTAGCGLKEAKEFVETLSAELFEKEPQKFAAPPSKNGCIGLLMAGTLVVMGMLFLIFC